ncbi:hypothetical protein IAT38_003719 [Cryptococcus sp. DSM 104549]
MRVNLLLPLIFLAPAFALPSHRQHHPNTASHPNRTPSFPSPPTIEPPSLFARLTNLFRPLSGYEDEDAHSPPPPRSDERYEGLKINEEDDEDDMRGLGYRRCIGAGRKGSKSGAEDGVAHYPGWRIAGDELSGPIAMSPRLNCIQVCLKYGLACSGTYYKETTSRCYLKGTKQTVWEFEKTGREEDATDLIGGCKAWSQLVPQQMDDVCCES